MAFWSVLASVCAIGLWLKGISVLPLLLIPIVFFLFECVRHYFKWQPPTAYLSLVVSTILLSFTSSVLSQIVIYGFVFWLLYMFRLDEVRHYAVKRVSLWRDEKPLHRIIGLAFTFLYCVLYLLPQETGISLFDSFHPLYELSIMQSFQHSILNVPDLSYAGKVLKFHFLGSQIPQLLAWVFHVSVLEAIGSHMMVFYWSLFVVVTYFLSKRGMLNTPFWVLFFFPLFGLKSIFFPPTPSILMGGILILLAVLFVLDKRRWIAAGVGGLLMVSKASFFPVFFGGVFLRDLIRRRLFMHWRWYVLMGLLFVVIFNVFFSGAHGHIMWIHFPFSVLSHLFNGNGALPLLYLPFLLLFCVGFISVKDVAQRLLVAIGLSGFLGITVLAEVTSGDHLQFLKGIGAIGVFGVWAVVSSVSLKGRLEKYDKFKFLALILCALVFAMPLTKRFMGHLSNPVVVLTTDKIEAYSWLSTQSQEGVVLYGPHYQVPKSVLGRAQVNAHWFQRSAYERSGLSGQQMYVESVKWKGVSTMPDISTRLAMAIQLYLSTVQFSEMSKKRIKLLYSDAFGTHNVVPHDRPDNFGKEWSWLNLQHKIAFEVKEQLATKSLKTDQEVRDFLKRNAIRFIVLEDGDLPDVKLYDLARVVYKNESHIIMEVL